MSASLVSIFKLHIITLLPFNSILGINSVLGREGGLRFSKELILSQGILA